MVSVPYESYRCVELKLEDAETENAAPRKENRDLKGQLNTAKEMRKASDEHVKELESAQDNLKNSHGADYERIRGYLRSIDKVFEAHKITREKVLQQGENDLHARNGVERHKLAALTDFIRARVQNTNSSVHSVPPSEDSRQIADTIAFQVAGQAPVADMVGMESTEKPDKDIDDVLEISEEGYEDALIESFKRKWKELGETADLLKASKLAKQGKHTA